MMSDPRRTRGGAGPDSARPGRRAESHVAELTAALADFAGCAQTAATLGARLTGVFNAGGRLLAAGNGGSAAQAQHLTAELVGRYQADRRPFSAICLSAETSSLTAIGNDYPPAELFARQVEAHGRPGDVLVVLSTSGRSPNVVEAARRAREVGLQVWAFTGPAPNPVAELADALVSVEADSTATVQELHLVALHLVCEALDSALGAGAGRQRADATSATEPTGPSAGNRPAAEPVPQPDGVTESVRSSGRRFVVVGDALLDVDLVGTARRLCPDAPVPVLDDLVEHPRPGGAALAAALAAADGHHVTLVTALDDEAGRLVERLLPDVHVVTIPFSGRTATKRRIRSAGQSLLRLDSDGMPGEFGPLPGEAVEAIAEATAVVVSDYGRGIMSHPQLRAALAGRPRRVPLVWDPHPRGATPVTGAQVVTPNEAEADGWAAGLVDTVAAHRGGGSRLARVSADAAALVPEWSAHAVAVTLGAAGALVSYGDGAPVVTPAPAVTCLDACGAGDRFAVSVAEGLAAGLVASEAVQAAVEAASAFVAAGGAAALCDEPQSLGDSAEAYPADAAEPERRPAGVGEGDQAVVDHDGADDDVPSKGDDRAIALASRARDEGATVVATGGCFDLLHAGHVATLRAARRLGDCLIVLLNSDDSVRRLKGSGRPLVPATDRARVLEALEFVDAVLVFDEDTPTQALTRVKPHIWAKGGDYAGRELPEATALKPWGGQVVALPYLGGRSTTDLLRTAARSAAVDGRDGTDVPERDSASPYPNRRTPAPGSATPPKQRTTGQEGRS